jgi:hypothetical protein
MGQSDTAYQHKKHGVDFARLDRMKDEDIDYSDAPKITPETFAKAIVRRGIKPPAKKTSDFTHGWRRFGLVQKTGGRLPDSD